MHEVGASPALQKRTETLGELVRFESQGVHGTQYVIRVISAIGVTIPLTIEAVCYSANFGIEPRR